MVWMTMTMMQFEPKTSETVVVLKRIWAVHGGGDDDDKEDDRLAVWAD
jgi:hypothetical protein